MSYIRISDPPTTTPHSSSSTKRMKSLFLRPSDPEHQRAPVSTTRRRKLIFSYLPDWLLTIVLAAIFFSLDKVDGYRRVFSVDDTSLRHPYAVHERVPNTGLYLICFVAPLLIQPVINLLTIRSWWDLHNSTLGLILGLALTGSVTQFSKITVGRPRPDIIDRCQPPAGTADPPFGLTNWTVCTQTDAGILRDGFRSFPSGHSSLSFAGLGFLAFYLAGKLHLFDRRGHAGKAWLAISPFSAAALVAISRTMDYRHHWHDVLVGSLLGTVISYFTYRQYYPSLAAELSHRPYSPRIKREDDDGLPMHAPRPSSSVMGGEHQESSSLSQYHAPHQTQHVQTHSTSAPYSGGYTNPFPENGYTGAAGTVKPSPHHHQQHHQQHHHHVPGEQGLEEYELEGTVQRTDVPLEEAWKDGEGEVSMPRSMSPVQMSSSSSPRSESAQQRRAVTAAASPALREREQRNPTA